MENVRLLRPWRYYIAHAMENTSLVWQGWPVTILAVCALSSTSAGASENQMPTSPDILVVSIQLPSQLVLLEQTLAPDCCSTIEGSHGCTHRFLSVSWPVGDHIVGAP
eukprot:9576048-Karenia_brevis.AAC.1